MLKNLKDYEAAMDKCSNCAFCEAACPVFLAELLETHVARSRVGIIRAALLDKSLPLTKRGRDVINRCLLCTRCVNSCPSGVPVDEIVIAARHLIYGGKRQNLPTRMMKGKFMDTRGFSGWRKRAFEMGKKGGWRLRSCLPLPKKHSTIFITVS